MRRIWLTFLLFWFSLWAFGQSCTSYTVVSAFDRKTGDPIEDLKAEDFEAKVGNAIAPVVSVTPINGRVLVLLEVDGTKSERIEETVSLVTRLARQAPDGKPLAFGVFAKRSLFTQGFNADSQGRAREISAVIEEAHSLGKRVALYDALHNALEVFGPHQPGDTVLLIGDGFDDDSDHAGQQIEKEFAAAGTRLVVELRQQPSDVTGNFLWKPPEHDRAILERLSARSGGPYIMFDAYQFGLPWRGYMLGISIPDNGQQAPKWKLRLGASVLQNHQRNNLYYPERLPSCATTEATPEPAEH